VFACIAVAMQEMRVPVSLAARLLFNLIEFRAVRIVARCAVGIRGRYELW
jgi:hypothetical protein